MQDKIDCNKINKIKKERITNLIYTDSATSHAYIQSSSNSLEIFTISINPLQILNTPWDPHPCVQDSPRNNPSLNYNSHNPRDNQSLDYNWLSEVNRKIYLLWSGWYKLKFLEKFLSFWDDNTIWSSWMNSQ